MPPESSSSSSPPPQSSDADTAVVTYTSHVSDSGHAPESFWLLPHVEDELARASKSQDALLDSALTLGVTPEMLRCALAKRRIRRLSPSSTTSATTTITLAEYLRFGYGATKDFWQEDVVKKLLIWAKSNRGKLTRKKKVSLAARKLGVDTEKVWRRIGGRDRDVDKNNNNHGGDGRRLQETRQTKKNENNDELSEYEKIRLRNIEKKQLFLNSLGFSTLKKPTPSPAATPTSTPQTPPNPSPKPEENATPLRMSLRRDRRCSTNTTPSAPQLPSLPVPNVICMPLDEFFTVDKDYSKGKVSLDRLSRLVSSPVPLFQLDFLAGPSDLSVVGGGGGDDVVVASSARLTDADLFPNADVTGLVAVGDESGRVGLWTADRTTTLLLKAHSLPVSSVTFNPFNAPQLISSARDGFIRSLDLEKQLLEVVYQWDFHHQEESNKAVVWHKFLSPFQLLLATQSDNVWCFDVRSGRETCHYLFKGNGSRVSLHPTNPNLLLSPTPSSTVSLYDVRKPDRPVRPPHILEQEAIGADFSLDGQQVLMSLRRRQGVGPDCVQVVSAGAGEDLRPLWSDHAHLGDATASWHPTQKGVLFYQRLGGQGAGDDCDGDGANCLVGVDIGREAATARGDPGHDYTLAREVLRLGRRDAAPSSSSSSGLCLRSSKHVPYMVLCNARGDGTLSLLAGGNAPQLERKCQTMSA